MDWYDYVLIAIGFSGATCLGRLILNHNWAINLLAGTIGTGLLLTIVAWFAPSAGRAIAGLLWIAAILTVLWRDRESIPQKRIDYTSLIFVGIAIGAFWHFSHTQYFYNNHDPAYWGYSFELLKADYLGPLRVPTFYPEQFAPSHILPSMAIAGLAALVPDATLPILIEVRFLFISIVWGGLLARLSSTVARNYWYFIFSVIGTFFVYESELGYNSLISSYLYVLIVGAIFTVAVSKAVDERALIFFSLALIAARGPIAYMAAGLAVFYWLAFKRFRFDAQIVVTVLLVGGIVSTWIVLPPPFTAFCQDLQTRIINPFSLDELSSLIQINEWLMPDIFQRAYFRSVEPIEYWTLLQTTDHSAKVTALLYVSPVVAYLLIKYYAVAGLAIWQLGFRTRTEPTRRKAFGGLILFLALSLVGWLLIRNGIQIAHQAHAYLVISTLAFLGLVTLASRSIKTLIMVSIVGGIFGLDSGLFDRPFSMTFNTGIPQKHIVFDSSDLPQKDASGFYTPEDGLPMWQAELRALMTGLRIRGEDFPEDIIDRELYGNDPDRTSIMPAWIISEKWFGGCEREDQN